jgi:hypothetical protein
VSVVLVSGVVMCVDIPLCAGSARDDSVLWSRER